MAGKTEAEEINVSRNSLNVDSELVYALSIRFSF